MFITAQCTAAKRWKSAPTDKWMKMGSTPAAEHHSGWTSRTSLSGMSQAHTYHAKYYLQEIPLTRDISHKVNSFSTEIAKAWFRDCEQGDVGMNTRVQSSGKQDEQAPGSCFPTMSLQSAMRRCALQTLFTG